MNFSKPENSNSFFRQSLFIFLIRFSPVLSTVLVLIYYGRSLDPAINGKYINFWAQLPLITAIACAGIHVLLPTYTLPYIVSLYRKLTRTQLTLYAIWVLTAGFLFGAMQTYAGYAPFFIAFFFLLVNAMTVISETFLIVARHFRSIASINLVYGILFCLLHWYVLEQHVPFDKLFIAMLLLAGIRFFLYVGMVVKDIRNTDVAATTEEAVADTRSLWLHMAFYDVSQLTFKWIDKVLISLVLTASLSAIYFYGTSDIPFLPVVISAVASTALIKMSHNKGDDKLSAGIMLHSMHLLSSVVFPVFFFLLFFRHELFNVLFHGKYTDSIPVFLSALLVLPLRACNFTVVLQNRHKGRVINTGAVADLLLACLLMYPFYRWWGLPGIAFAFTFTTYLQSTYYLYHTAKTLKVRFVDLLPYRNWLTKLLVFGILFMLLHKVTAPHFPELTLLFIGSGVVLALALISLRMELKKSTLTM